VNLSEINISVTEKFAEFGEHEHKKILTEKARSVICSAINNGQYKDREDATEPPFMAPSENLFDYSWVSH
jgi:hypothetical protein